MIKYSELNELFSKLSFPCTEYNFEIEEEIALPYAAYAKYDDSIVHADGVNLCNILLTRLIFLDSEADSSYQKEIENLFEDNEIGYVRSYEHDNEQRFYITTYSFSTIDG